MTAPRFDAFRVLLGALLCLVLSAFMASSTLVDIAERMEFGPDRDRWLQTALVVDEASHNLFLDRPGDIIRTMVGADGDQPEEVVLGELANSAGVAEPSAVDPLSYLAEETALDLAEGPNGQSAATDTPGSGESDANPSAGGSDGSAVQPGEATPSVSQAELVSMREVAEADPLRIWMGGDSLGQFIAGHIAYRIAPPSLTDIAIDYRISTGLARPDYFDWPAHLSDVAAAAPRPEALIYMVGGNDDQPMRLQEAVLEPATPEWREEYRRRVGVLMDVAAYEDTQMLWVLLPPMRDDRRAGISDRINDTVRSQAELRPWVSVVEIEDLFLDADGDYSQFVPGPDGEQQLARQNDGVHITEIGSRWVAERVWAEILLLWPTLATAAE